MDFHNSTELLLESTCFLSEENVIQPAIKLTTYSPGDTEYLWLLPTYWVSRSQWEF